MTEVLAVIPARGGSKRLPRKNILPVDGKPLIAHSIEMALKAVSVSRCIVSTEDKEIADVSLQYGSEISIRPSELAADSTPTNKVVLDLLQTLGESGYKPEYLILLQPTSPLRTAVHIDEAVARLTGSDANSVISVCPAEHHPLKTLIEEDNELRPLFDDSSVETPEQELPEVLRPNGAIFCVRTSAFIDSGKFLVPKMLPYLMPGHVSVDVDSAQDLQFAEFLMNNRHLDELPE
jgi:CMP-N,N'-diacetyllegionaminic acid synthase